MSNTVIADRVTLNADYRNELCSISADYDYSIHTTPHCILIQGHVLSSGDLEGDVIFSG